MEIFLAFLSIGILVVFALYVLYTNSKINYYKVVSKNLASMKIIQSMFEIMGANIKGSTKIEELNKIIINSYGCAFSSIVVFDGLNYNIASSNVEEIYIESLLTLHEESDFKDNIFKNISKYITTNSSKTLNYNSAIERNIRSCIFSPIYHNKTFLGYWIIEDEFENAFDDISKSELAKLKNNMGVFLESIKYEELIESIENTDKQTGLYNSIFLYSVGRKELLKNDKNCVCLLDIVNLSKINLEYSRNFGNIIFNKLINLIKEYLPKDCIKIRYSGARILIIFLDTDAKSVHNSMEGFLSKIKAECIEKKDDMDVELDINILMHDIKKQSNIEKEVESMIKYVSSTKEINTIKIM